MSARKSVIGIALAALIFMAALALAACGGGGTSSSSGGVSTLDPAAAAPADSLAYLGITVRPQGSEAGQVAETINKLAGRNDTAKLPKAVNKLLASSKSKNVTYQQMKPWLGENVGVDLVNPSGGSFSGSLENSVVLIFPTSNTSAAASWAKQAMKQQGSGPRSIYKIAGNYLLVGGKNAVSAAASAVSSGNSLASSSSYKSDSANLAPDAIIKAYVNVHGLLTTLGPELDRMGGAESQTLTQLTHQLGSDATVGFGLELKPSEIRFDVTHTGNRSAAKKSSSNVGSLPADSWLAVSDNAISSEADVHKVEANFGRLLGSLTALQQLSSTESVSLDTASRQLLMGTPTLLLIYHDVLPALGPLSLSIAGTSPLDLKVGVDLNSVNKTAQTKLLSTLYSYAHQYVGTSKMKGSPNDFAIEAGLASAAKVTREDGRMVATYGYPNAAAFLHPSATLAGNSGFKQALAQLPAGASNVPLYLNFNDIAALASIDKNPSDASTMRVLKVLKYAIVGSTASDSRIVIGLH